MLYASTKHLLLRDNKKSRVKFIQKNELNSGFFLYIRKIPYNT